MQNRRISPFKGAKMASGIGQVMMPNYIGNPHAFTQ